MIAGARAESTLKQQELGWKQWTLYSSLQEKGPYLLGWTDAERRADEERVIKLVEHCSRVMGWKADTVKGKIGTLVTGHVRAGYGNPVNPMERVRRMTQAMRREKGAPAKKLPFIAP